MNYDHNAIYRAYPDIGLTIEDGFGIKDEDGKEFVPDESLVAAAREQLNKEVYKNQRQEEYPDWGTQLDYIYHNGIEKWKTDIVDPVKAKYPKPST